MDLKAANGEIPVGVFPNNKPSVGLGKFKALATHTAGPG